jgi:Ankyrin repeats (3 copies)
MLSPTGAHKRRSRWAIAGLEAGAVLFLGGLAILYLNPFWHFDQSGLLDSRVFWWNAAGEILTATGILTEALALVGGVAVLLSRWFGQRSWPYALAALLVLSAVVWSGLAGFTRTMRAHFEWNSADNFNVFRLQAWDEAGTTWREEKSPIWQSIVETQLQPLLKNYFKLNDWQKMNGDVPVKVVRIIPIAWPVDLGSGGETLEDPDETDLMRAAAQEDLKAVQGLLSGTTSGNVNALDQTGQTALILACQNPKANPDVVKALIAAGADVNLRSQNGYTALTWALARNNGEVIRLLRRAGGRK